MAQTVQIKDKNTEKQLKELVKSLRLSGEQVLKLAIEQLWLTEGQDHQAIEGSCTRSLADAARLGEGVGGERWGMVVAMF